MADKTGEALPKKPLPAKPGELLTEDIFGWVMIDETPLTPEAEETGGKSPSHSPQAHSDQVPHLVISQGAVARGLASDLPTDTGTAVDVDLPAAFVGFQPTHGAALPANTSPGGSVSIPAHLTGATSHHIPIGSVYKSYAFMTCSFSNQRDRPTMDHKQFQDWLSGIDHLSPAQRQEAETVFMGVSEASSSLAAIEASVGESRQCPHCGTPGAISRGKARGLRRYQCKGCNKTFNAATGTPLSGLHRKDKWLAFGTCLSDGLTVRASAERCKFAVNTAFRWRHRFLTTDNPKARKLTGIVEVDETYVLQSQKGERNLERKARRRGGKARKRGLSDEQVPVLVAADRSGMTVSAVLPAVNADTLQSAIEPVVDDDIVLVTDGHRAYPPCAAALGVRHEALNLSGGERVRDAFHIQTVNNRHSQLKDFLRRYRGVATKYLDNYLRWFQRLQLENASPRACRATAIADPCIRFVN